MSKSPNDSIVSRCFRALRISAGAFRRELLPKPLSTDSSEQPLPFTRNFPQFSGYDIGIGTYGVPSIYWHKPGRKLTIGNYCSIAPGVIIMLGGNHFTDRVTSFPLKELFGKPDDGLPMQETTRGDVWIGSDVWLAKDSMIMSGVTIGHGAIIAAKSVVTKDVPPYSITGGNPARHLKYRVDESLIPDLLAIAWWNWPQDKVIREIPSLLSNDLRAFIEKHRVSPLEAARS